MPATAKHVIVFFLDGVGLGEDNPETNPLAAAELPSLVRLLGGARPVLTDGNTVHSQAAIKGLDARLGIPGLPQSGTGQVTILSGTNAAAYLGRHDGPYPNEELRQLLARENLFSTLLARGKSVAFANAYSDRFLERLGRGTQRLSANARAALEAGLKLRGPAELRAGRGVSALFTNEYFLQMGYDVPEIDVEQAGRHLVLLAEEHALTYFEFWYSDVVGHRKDRALALHLLAQVDAFVGSLLAHMDADNTLLLLVSDHGNLEDLSTNKHTLNPALGILTGAGFNQIQAKLSSLADIKPAILSALV